MTTNHYFVIFFTLLIFLCTLQPTGSFRVLQPGSTDPNGTYPKPYDTGFVGVYGDATNYQRERINEGAFETSDQELFYEGVTPRQACPNMVGPFSDGNYYCSAREFGYCDRRSGTCFCNVGYQGIDCSECQDSHFKIGAHCYPKKLCPNDCSGAGKCNFNNGTCTCLPHRAGPQCDILLCSTHSPLCVTCTKKECLQCSGGYYLTGDSRVCSSCYDFDPRCAGCIKEEGCTVCADSTLTSVRRSGYRRSDPALPEEENNREFSITLPFGTKSAESFADAENYFVCTDEKSYLKDKALTCSQGENSDDGWTCRQFEESHKVCGHFGIFTLLYPNYAISERSNYIRMYVQRTGGGYGNVTLNYYIKHYTTNDSDVMSTASYTTSQQLRFDDGIVQRSFLITILDDNIVEENEVFQVVLETPEGGGSVGAQFRANITIIDDDLPLTSPKLTRSIENTTSVVAGETVTVTVVAASGNGSPQTLGGDKFFSLLENDLSTWIAPLSSTRQQRQTRRKACNVLDLGNGKYQVSTAIADQGVYQMRTWHAFPNSIKGEYFYDAYFENIAVTRLDHAVNFTWGAGRLIPRGTDYISIRWSGAFMTLDTGLYKFKIDADDNARLWVDGDLILDHFHERAVNLQPSRSLYLQGNTLYEVVMEYREIVGEAYARLMWQPPTATKPEVIPQSQLYSLFEIDKSPVLVTVKSASTAANMTECTGDGLYHGVARRTSYFHVCPRDQFGNFRDDDNEFLLATEYFEAQFTLVDDSGFNGVGSESIAPHLQYNHRTHCFDGHYVPQRSGVYELQITHKLLPDDDAQHVAGSPFTIYIEPDQTSGPMSDVWGLVNPLEAEAGYCYNFTLVMRDNARNLRLQGGDDIKVYMFRVNYFNESIANSPADPNNSKPSNAPTQIPTARPSTLATVTDETPDKISDSGADVVRMGIVTDLGNGNYSVQVCPVIQGVHEIHILLKGKGVSNQNFRVMDIFQSKREALGRGSYFGQYIANSPYQLVVTHTRASVITTTAAGTGLVDATVGVPAFFKITVRDPYDNVLRTENNQPVMQVKLDRSPTAPVSIWDYNNGSYLVEYVAQLSGANYISVYVDGFQIKNSPFEVPTFDGKTTSKYSYAEGAGLHVGTTGKKSYFQLFSYDLDGNRKTGYNDHYTFTVNGANNLTGSMLPCPDPRVENHAICDPFDHKGGYYWAEFEPLNTGIIKVSVFLQANASYKTEVSNSPFTAVIYPSGPKAENTDVTGTLQDNTAGVPAYVHLQARDYFGNKLITGGKNVELVLLGVGVDWGTYLPFEEQQGLPNQYNYKGFYAGYPDYYGTLVDNMDGTYTIEYNVDKSGMYVMRIAMQEEGLNATYFNGTTLGHLFDKSSYNSEEYKLSLQGKPVNYGLAISWTGDIGGRIPSSGGLGNTSSYGDHYRSRMEPVVNVSNSNGIQTYLNSSQGSRFNFREHYWSARWTGMITPKFAEIYKIVIELDDDSTANLWLGGVGVQTNRSYLGEHVLNVTLNNRVKVGYYNFTDVRYREFLLEFAHFTGDAQLRLYWESLSTPYSMIPATAFSHWRNISHFNVTIHPNTGLLCSRCSTAYGKSLTQARVNEEQSFTIYGRDRFNNLVQQGGDVPSMVAIGRDGVAFRGKVIDYGNSTYLIKYFPTQAGTFKMYITIGCCAPNPAVGYPNEIELIEPLLVQGAPYTLHIDPAPLNPSRSIAIGNGVVGGIAGEQREFTVVYRDVFNNPTAALDPSAVKITVRFLDAKTNNLEAPDLYEITHRTANNITIAYTHNKAGNYKVHISLDYSENANLANFPVEIVSSPFDVVISPAEPEYREMIVRGVGMRYATVQGIADAMFEIQLYDRFKNTLIVGGDKFYLRLNGDANFSHARLPVVPSCVDTQNGRYRCTYRPKYDRQHELVVRLLQNSKTHPGGNGLLGQYFTTIDGATRGLNDLPMFSKVDAMVKMAWKGGYYIPYTEYRSLIELGQPVSHSKVVTAIPQSIRWSGYLVAPRTDEFFITAATSKLHVSVFIDEVLVYDNTPSPTNITLPIVAKSVNLLADAAYEIRIEAQIAENVAVRQEAVAVDLRWATATVQPHSISTFFLYDTAHVSTLSPFPVTVDLV